MIYKALSFISEILNEFLTKETSSVEGKVVLNRIENHDGSLPPENENKIVCTLINIEEEHTIQRNLPVTDRTNENRKNPFSIFILLTANFHDYSESLRMLDSVMSFFYQHSLLNAETKNNFPADLSRISLELFTTTVDQTGTLAGSLMRFSPSVIYKANII